MTSGVEKHRFVYVPRETGSDGLKRPTSAASKPHTVPSGTGDQLPVTSSGLGLGTQSPAIGWGLTGDWGLSLQPEGWDWGLSHQLMLGTAAGLGTGVPA